MSGGEFGCQTIMQVSQGELSENGNLTWNKRVKARLILILSTNTNCESMVYRSFSLCEFQTRGVRKVTTGITGLWQPSLHSDVAFECIRKYNYNIYSVFYITEEMCITRIVRYIVYSIL